MFKLCIAVLLFSPLCKTSLIAWKEVIYYFLSRSLNMECHNWYMWNWNHTPYKLTSQHCCVCKYSGYPLQSIITRHILFFFLNLQVHCSRMRRTATCCWKLCSWLSKWHILYKTDPTLSFKQTNHFIYTKKLWQRLRLLLMLNQY